MYVKRYKKLSLLLTFCLLLIPQTLASADIKKVGRTTSSITVNTSGTYTLTVSDNGCLANTSVNVVVNPKSL